MGSARNTGRCRVVGRARTIGNRVTVKSGSRVRIPPSPPEKSTHLSTKTNVCFFQRNLPLRASEIASLWNICFANVKYSLTRMWANFISHRTKWDISQCAIAHYFTFGNAEYFTKYNSCNFILRAQKIPYTQVCGIFTYYLFTLHFSLNWRVRNFK